MNDFERKPSHYCDSTSDKGMSSAISSTSSFSDSSSDPASSSVSSSASSLSSLSFLRYKTERLSDDSEEDERKSEGGDGAKERKINDSDDSSGSQQSEGDEFLRMKRTKHGGNGEQMRNGADRWQKMLSPSPRKKSKMKRKRKRSHDDDDENGDVKPSKRKRPDGSDASDVSFHSTPGQSIMEKMGYKRGEGLGKYSQGRVTPIEESKQKGRRGLGLVLADVDRALINYDPTIEDKSAHEQVSWLDGKVDYDLTPSILASWMEVGPKKRILDDECNFCDADVLQNVLLCKSVFDKITGEQMRVARSRSNPYELIKKGPYINRAAMKMANLDHVFDNMFTNPVDEHERSLVARNDLLYFADVCAGPGGFSEYILSRKKWEAKGFGFTLKGDCDFKLSDFTIGPCESFEPFYGTHDDGDVYKSDNIVSFHKHVLDETNGIGVHFMMADGGFSVEGNENIQEILSKRIYLCQTLVALSVVRPGGHFVCKFFDMFTPFSVGIVYLLYLCFQRISIHKPVTSRPANSERYIVCKWKRHDVESVRRYLFHVNEQFDQYGETSESDINEVVPVNLLKNDGDFYAYVVSSNNSLGKKQVNGLAKLLKFSEDETLFEEKQNELKKECMELWGVPMSRVANRSQVNVESVSRQILQNDTQFIRKPMRALNVQIMQECLRTVHDFHAVILGSKSATFFLSIAHKKCYKWSANNWTPVTTSSGNSSLELSPDTLIYGEIVKELIGSSTGQRKIDVLHIIDGHTLGGKNISGLHYTERLRECALFAKSLTRRSMFSVMGMKVKPAIELDQLRMTLENMTNVVMKNQHPKLVVPIGDNYHIIPVGIMFVKGTKKPYQRFLSKTHNAKYYCAPKKESKFDDQRPQEAVLTFKESFESSFVWYLDEDENVPFNRQLFLRQLISFIEANRHWKP